MKPLCIAATLILCVTLTTLPTSTASTVMEDKLYTAAISPS